MPKLTENRYGRATTLWCALSDTDGPLHVAASLTLAHRGHVPGAFRRKAKRLSRIDRLMAGRPVRTTRQCVDTYARSILGV